MQTATQQILPSGLTLVHQEDFGVPLVSVQAWVKTGSVHEAPLLGSGISHFVEHLVFKHAGGKAAQELTSAIHACGGYLNAYTTFDRTVYYIDIPAEHAALAVELLGDLVLRASFRKGDIESERDVVLREIDLGQDDPNHQLFEAALETTFPVHPMGLPIIGKRAAFARITRTEAYAYYKARYVPSNMAFSIAGALKEADALKLAEQFLTPGAEASGAGAQQELGSLAAEASSKAAAKVERDVQHNIENESEHTGENKGEDNNEAGISAEGEAPVFTGDIPQQARQTGVQNTRLIKKHLELTRGALAIRTAGLGHEDMAGLDVLSAYLGLGQGAHLVQVLRNQKGLVHDIDAGHYTPCCEGVLLISYVADAAQPVEAALEGILKQTATQPISAVEVDRARVQLQVRQLNAQKTLSGRASKAAHAQLMMNDLTYPEKYLKALAAVTPEDLNRLAAQYCVPENCNWVTLSGGQ